MYFFIKAEDGIRDADVTGVQTCALPIYVLRVGDAQNQVDPADWKAGAVDHPGFDEGFVGYAHVQVVGRPELYAEQVDCYHFPDGGIHLDGVTNLERLFHHQEQATDDVGGGGLGGKADSDRENTGSAQHHVQGEASFRSEEHTSELQSR